MGGAAHFSSHGRCRQGWYDQARSVGREPARLPGLFFQVALRRGSRPRFSLALHEMPAESRAHWHFQSELLRGNACGARASGVSGKTKDSIVSYHETHLGGAIRGYSRLRTLPRPQRRPGREILSARFSGRTEATLFAKSGTAGKELEVFRLGHGGA